MTTSGLSFVTVDVFTEQRYGGNPLAIVLVPEDRSPSQEEKQAFAKETNLSETVFLHVSNKSTESAEWTYDIFTTDRELNFAGHPTIGTAWWIHKQHPHLKKARLLAKAGPVEITYEKHSNGTVYATANIPHNIHVHASTLSADDFRKMQPSLASFKGELIEGSPVVSIVKGMTFAYSRIHSMDALRALKLCAIPTETLVTVDEGWGPTFTASFFYYIDESKSTGDSFKLNCRMIDSAFGEDAATGSGSAGLGAYLAMEAAKKNKGLRKLKVDIDQGVEMGRPSKIRMELTLNEEGKIETILQSGSAVHVMEGTIV